MVGRMIEMSVESVRVHMFSTQHVVILRELERDRYLPIWIGPWEASAIAMKLQGQSPERPLTHDLFAEAIERLDLAQQRGERVRKSLEKFYVEPSEVFTEPIVLGAAYALREARPPHEPGIEKPNVVEAAVLLRRNAYRPLLVRRLDQKANYFHAATMIANSAGIFHLTRVLDFAGMPEVIASLERHWVEERLTEKAA